jgi:hypothetical protein
LRSSVSFHFTEFGALLSRGESFRKNTNPFVLVV